MEDFIKQILETIKDPITGKKILEVHVLENIVVKEKNLQLTLKLHPKTSEEMREKIYKIVYDTFYSLSELNTVTVILTSEKTEVIKGTKGIKHSIAVASAKGGVGKSTTAVNLAISLRKKGLQVGLFDADVFGPSQPKMLHIEEKLDTSNPLYLKPIEQYGIKVMSMGLIIGEDKPVIWRGPMVMQAIKQMLEDVQWGEIDVLIIDMPPGTGDTQLTLAQTLSLSGAVIVSTPQDIALIDVRKGTKMFQKVKVPIIGIIENMSVFVCPHCNKESYIFGKDGAKKDSENLNISFLGEIPLDISVRETSDMGYPIVVKYPESRISYRYREIVEKVCHFLKI